MILLALSEGWRLRYADSHGWCLFQAGRQRPFAQIASSTVEKMTRSGWLSAGIATKELGFRPEKILTKTGRRYAQKLIDKRWAEDYEWSPYRMPGEVDASSTLGELEQAMEPEPYAWKLSA
jgi:hypothetical protein